MLEDETALNDRENSGEPQDTRNDADESGDQNSFWKALAEVNPEGAEIGRRKFVPKSEFTKVTQQLAQNTAQMNSLAQEVAYLRGAQNSGTPAQKKAQVDAFLEENAGDDPGTAKTIKGLAAAIEQGILEKIAPALNPIIQNQNLAQAEAHIEAYRDTFKEAFGDKGDKRFADVKRKMIEGFRSTGAWQTPEQVFAAHWQDEFAAARTSVVAKQKQKKQAEDAAVTEGFQAVRRNPDFTKNGKPAASRESDDDVIRRNAKKFGLAL